MASIFLITLLDYTHKSQNGYQQNYGVFCGFLEDSNSLSTEKDIEVLKGHVHQKMILVLGRIRERICAFRLVKVGTFWKFVIILFHEVIASGKKLFLYLEVLHLIS